MKDLNATTIEAAEKIIAGTARSMGVEIIGIDSSDRQWEKQYASIATTRRFIEKWQVVVNGIQKL